MLWSQDYLEENKFSFQYYPFLDHLDLEPPPPLSGGKGGGSLKPSDLKWNKTRKKNCCSSKPSCDDSAPVSFPFWPFFICGLCYSIPIPGHPWLVVDETNSLLSWAIMVTWFNINIISRFYETIWTGYEKDAIHSQQSSQVARGKAK